MDFQDSFLTRSRFDEIASSSAILSINKTLSSQADALANLRDVYASDEFARSNMEHSLRIMHHTSQVKGGKIVVCGVGKLYKIAQKLVATFNSLSIFAQGLHPTEALHGDLGLVRESRDCVLFITASGNTPELIQLLPHLDRQIPILLLTSNKELKLAMHPQVTSLMYAPLGSHHNEVAVHGLPAPTVLATLALVLADAAILALSEIVETDLPERRRRFSMKHPGGSIGADLSHLNTNVTSPTAPMLREQRALSSSGLASSFLSLGQLRTSLKQAEGQRVGSTSSSSSDQLLWENDTDDEAQAEFSAGMVDQALSLAVKAAPSALVLSAPYSKILAALEAHDELQLLRWLAQYDFVTYQCKRQMFACATTSIRPHYAAFCASQNWKELLRSVLATFKMVS